VVQKDDYAQLPGYSPARFGIDGSQTSLAKTAPGADPPFYVRQLCPLQETASAAAADFQKTGGTSGRRLISDSE